MQQLFCYLTVHYYCYYYCYYYGLQLPPTRAYALPSVLYIQYTAVTWYMVSLWYHRLITNNRPFTSYAVKTQVQDTLVSQCIHPCSSVPSLPYVTTYLRTLPFLTKGSQHHQLWRHTTFGPSPFQQKDINNISYDDIQSIIWGFHSGSPSPSFVRSPFHVVHTGRGIGALSQNPRWSPKPYIPPYLYWPIYPPIFTDLHTPHCSTASTVVIVSCV